MIARAGASSNENCRAPELARSGSWASHMKLHKRLSFALRIE
jgi:hypothetical protein